MAGAKQLVEQRNADIGMHKHSLKRSKEYKALFDQYNTKSAHTGKTAAALVQTARRSTDRISAGNLMTWFKPAQRAENQWFDSTTPRSNFLEQL